MSNSTLSYYWDLASLDAQKRGKACSQLISVLKQFQAEFKPTELTSYEDIKSTCAPDIAYALKRLIRGLSSSRDAAREGFAVALTELLRLLPTLPASLGIQLIHDISAKNGTKTGLEERELYFARIFGYQALALSGTIARESTKLEDIEQISLSLLSFGRKKDYLKVAVCSVFILTLNAVQQHSKHKEYSESIITSFLEGNQESPETIWFAIEARKICPSFKKWEQVLSNWKKGRVSDRKNQKKLMELLKSATYHTVHLHPAFKSLISEISEDNDKCITLLGFWNSIEETFFNSSHDRKSIGFQIFECLLEVANIDQLPMIFTPNFMRCLINSLSSKETYLNEQAKHTTGELVRVAKENEKTALPLVMQLLGKNGHYKFDSLTKTRTVESILTNLTPESILKYLNHLVDIFFNPTKISANDSASGSQRDIVQVWVLEQMYLLFRTSKIVKEEVWVTFILNFYICHGLFEVTKSVSDDVITKKLSQPIAESTRSAFGEKLIGSLVYLKKSSLVCGEKTMEMGDAPGGFSWPYFILQKIEYFKKKGLKFVAVNSSETNTAVQNGLETIKSIRDRIDTLSDKNSATAKELKCFEALFSHLCLFLVCGLEENSEVIEELQNCYQLLLPISPNLNGKKRKRAEDVPEPVEVLADVLISFLAKPSVALRTLASEVFAVFAPKATENVVQVIFDVLNAKTGAEGAEELFEAEEEPEEGSNESESNTDSDSSQEDSSEEEEDTDEVVDEELRSKLEAALKAQNLAAGDEELSDVGDDDMAAFDEKLAEIFSQRKAIKKMKKETKESVLHFKLRVLDLLDIFLKTCMGNGIVLKVLETLLQLAIDTGKSEETRTLHDKLISIILNRFKAAKEVPQADSGKEALELLQKVHHLSKAASSAPLFNLLSVVSLFLVKIISKTPSTDFEKPKSKKRKAETPVAVVSNAKAVANIYSASYVKMMENKNSQIRHKLFTDLIARFPEISWEFLTDIMKQCDLEKKPRTFLLVKSLEMCVSIFKGTPKNPDDIQKDIYLNKIQVFVGLLEKVLEAIPTMDESGPFSISKDRIKSILKCIAAVIRKSKFVLKEDEFQSCFTKSKIAQHLKHLLENSMHANNNAIKSVALEINKQLA